MYSGCTYQREKGRNSILYTDRTHNIFLFKASAWTFLGLFYFFGKGILMQD